MPLSIIGAGYGRTGTLSLKRALDQLGVGPCFHGLDGTRGGIESVLRALDREPVDWEEIFAGYSAAVDVPAYWAYRELAERYPDATVILTTREPKSWFESMQALNQSFEHISLAEESLELRRSLQKKVLSGAFGDAVARIARSPDRASRIAAYEAHNAEVRRSIPAHRLLEFNVRQGWAPLCRYLGVPQPDSPFPHANSRADLPSLLRGLFVGEYVEHPSGA